MVASSGPSGILAGRPSSLQRQEANNNSSSNNNLKKQQHNQQQLDDKRHESDMFVRPSWFDAGLALDQLEKGKAEGQRSAVWIRARLQDELSQLGCFLQRHPGKVLFVAVLALATFCVALKSVNVHSRVEQLWVQEGGRLERELRYATENLGEPATSTHQLVIQTPRDPNANILNANALREHLAVLKVATEVSVRVGDALWRLKDMCYAPAVPNFEQHFVDQIFDGIVPCAIITPLDCFWEGSQLLGPKDPIRIPGVMGSQPLKWPNLNPVKMLEDIKKLNFTFPYKILEDFMKRAGITNGYQGKPCLNPQDPACPETAPNKNATHPPDVGKELANGCYGFAAKFMHWPKELMVGGAKHNKSGHLIRAAALQTVIQLMGEQELYDFWSKKYKVHNDDNWSREKAALVLDKWQRAFTKALKTAQNDNEAARYNHYAFSTTTMNDILGTYSKLDVLRVVVGCALIVGYAGVFLYNCKDRVRSQSGVAMAGVMLVVASLAAGLGFCSLLGIPFNAASTQIVPFLCLGLGVHDMFQLTHTYAESSVNDVPSNLQTAVILKRSGLSVLLTSLCHVAAFFAAAIIPIPAMRVFCLQAGILLLFNLAATLLVFPAMISLDLRRRRSGRSDIFCCCLPALTELKRSGSKPYSAKQQNCMQALTTKPESTQGDLEAGEDASLTGCSQDDCLSFSLNRLVSKYYAPFITSSPTKVIGVLMLIALLVASTWQAMRIDDGLELADLLPANSDEHAFLAAQSKHFGFYNMFAVTGRDFDYPNHQRLLYDYHDAFIRVKHVIKNDNGGLPEFWLGLFRNWLINLQRAFDRDHNNNCITSEGWHPNATDEGILAYKLLVQTGDVDNPVDKSLVTQVRLVNSEGIINPHAFYNYLSAWATNDALAYGASQANLRPQPSEWFYVNKDIELKIPKSAPITYAQMPLYLYKLSNTTDITELIASVRAVCRKFEEKGLPNFPSGIPFVFWEQYMDLRSCLGMALLAALGACVFVVGILLLNLWAAILVGVVLAAVVLQLLGIMAAFGIKLSAVTAILLVLSVGIAVRFTGHICLSFITSVGSRDRRVRLALEHMCTPVIHGAATTLLAVIMLGFSEFEFIVRYFFFVLICLIVCGLVNGLFFFPILLSLIGPSAEVIPNEHPDRISTPTPPASPVIRRRSAPKISAPPKRLLHRIEESTVHSEPSSGRLTTIDEEPNSWHSQQESCIIVQPEVKVETSTCANQNCNGSDSSSSSRTSPVPPSPHITTKVTATVSAKIEVHTPLCRSNRSDKCRHSSSNRSRSSRSTTLVNTAESSGSSSEPESDASSTNYRSNYKNNKR